MKCKLCGTDENRLTKKSIDHLKIDGLCSDNCLEVYEAIQLSELSHAMRDL